MSSSHEIDSLSGLASYAASVEKLLYGSEPITQESFDRLQDELNRLQVNCPNHNGVVEARVRWFEIQLENFELHVVTAVEGDIAIDLDRIFWGTHGNSLIIGGPQTIQHFLKRHYLKSDFKRLYQRVLSLYDRLARCDTDGEGFTRQAQNLRDNLLEGRL